MEIPMKYLVAILLAIMALAGLGSMWISSQKNIPDVALQEKYYRGCRILATNGCDFNFQIDGENFENIVKKMNLTKDIVRERCCR